MAEPMTDAELAEAECQGAELRTHRPQVPHGETICRLAAEVRRLREQVVGHAGRIAKQSELLSRRAEKAWTRKTPGVDGHYWQQDVARQHPPLIVYVRDGQYAGVAWTTPADDSDYWWSGPLIAPLITSAPAGPAD